jgi:hypothetical protein
MKRTAVSLLIAAGVTACSDRRPSTERIVVERERQVPTREIVVERSTRPTADGGLKEERVVRERIVPRTQVQRTETITTQD